MSRAIHLSTFFSTAMIVTTSYLSSACAEIRVTMRPEVAISQETVTLGDLASISASLPGLAQKVRELDLDVLEQVGDETRISRRQVEIRILLEQYERTPPRVDGAEQSIVRRAEPATLVDSVVEQQLTQKLAEFWQLPTEQITLQLAAPLDRMLPVNFELQAGDRLEPLLQPSMVPGNLRIPVGIYRDTELVETFSVSVTAYVEREVAIASRVIRVGDPMKSENIRFAVQRLTGRAALETTSRDVLGQFATRTMTAGTLIRQSSLQQVQPVVSTPRVTPEETPTIPARSRVTLIARRNGLEARYGGAQLLRPTRVGQNTVVKNNAGVEVEGTLISPGEVLVRLR